ncbi:hypothetical protein MAR_021354 [Mya arenaria]|uniref:C2H2-type domain-containing protein n=1 Tax=Mya arenaria TaxID=6604 RepID=A0ABY7E7Y9_MYAAR|nr:hypothetical protein MAR_021354 [Mya arenaria]
MEQHHKHNAKKVGNTGESTDLMWVVMNSVAYASFSYVKEIRQLLKNRNAGKPGITRDVDIHVVVPSDKLTLERLSFDLWNTVCLCVCVPCKHNVKVWTAFRSTELSTDGSVRVSPEVNGKGNNTSGMMPIIIPTVVSIAMDIPLPVISNMNSIPLPVSNMNNIPLPVSQKPADIPLPIVSLSPMPAEKPVVSPGTSEKKIRVSLEHLKPSGDELLCRSCVMKFSKQLDYDTHLQSEAHQQVSRPVNISIEEIALKTKAPSKRKMFVISCQGQGFCSQAYLEELSGLQLTADKIKDGVLDFKKQEQNC